jgi:hypothetical protein
MQILYPVITFGLFSCSLVADTSHFVLENYVGKKRRKKKSYFNIIRQSSAKTIGTLSPYIVQ